MKHIWALIIKFVIITVILEIVLMMTTALTWVDILSISITLTILAYLISDLLVLSLSNNIVATIADAGLAFVVIYFYNYRFGFGSISYGDAIIAAVVIGVGEWFFHKYMARTVYPDRDHDRHHRVKEVH